MRFLISVLFTLCWLLTAAFPRAARLAEADPPDPSRNLDFNSNWKFIRCDATTSNHGYQKNGYDDQNWQSVLLPHTAKIEPLVVNDQWQGVCWYRKTFFVSPKAANKKIYIEFEGAMQTADVWVNGKHKTTHYGGYLPFFIDISDDIDFEKDNVIAVRLDNRDDPETPPGKPLKELDFCMYGGLYRNVNMHITDKLHITDAVSSNQTAGGGIFVRYPVVTREMAQILTQTHLINEYDQGEKFALASRLFDTTGKLIVEKVEKNIELAAFQDKHITQTIEIWQPQLWHPDSPYLYKLHSIIYKGDSIVDQIETTIGIRRISFEAQDGFKINGKKVYLRGANRHQEYPYVGYALSDNANYRDAVRIKQAGFNFVRLSHYPHSVSFMRACDELGLLVMDAIPGWQFFGNERFQQRSLQDCRDMIRRDRNHPSVILWEVSLNESDMSKAFMEKAHRIAHEEYPGDQTYTCGWLDYVYDVFIPARQHAKPPDYWKKYNKDKPLLIAEYGDWEYYAQNAGFNQAAFKDLAPEDRTSRQLRKHGERRMLQQALNYQEAFNDNLATSAATGCANWLIFDYNRGYANDIEASGIQDLFRIPKFANYFYQSQRQPGNTPYQAPVLFIADYWTENADGSIKIFSNVDKVKLALNDKIIASGKPDRDRYSTNLKFPPFTFQIDQFQPGRLEAFGYINGQQVVAHQRITPGEPAQLQLPHSCGDIMPTLGKKDLFFAYASITDRNDSLVPDADHSVQFELSGSGRLIGRNPVNATAGIASIVVETFGLAGKIEIAAKSAGLSTPKNIVLRLK